MTLGELRRHVLATSPEHDDLEVKVWLPGSTISVNAMGAPGLKLYKGKMLLEGNVDEGSALRAE